MIQIRDWLSKGGSGENFDILLDNPAENICTYKKSSYCYRVEGGPGEAF